MKSQSADTAAIETQPLPLQSECMNKREDKILPLVLGGREGREALEDQEVRGHQVGPAWGQR